MCFYKYNKNFCAFTLFFFIINFVVSLASIKYISQRFRSNTDKFLENTFVYFAIFEFKRHIYDFLVHILKTIHYNKYYLRFKVDSYFIKILICCKDDKETTFYFNGLRLQRNEV